MREHKDHVKTTITLKDNTLRLTLTEANHIYVEAEDGWMYRGRRLHCTAHVVFNGQEWVYQPALRYNDALYCPDATSAGHKAIASALLLSLNTVVVGREWFDKLRAQAEATACNNEIMRADEKIAELEKQLQALRDQREKLMVAEGNAVNGVFAPFYVKE